MLKVPPQEKVMYSYIFSKCQELFFLPGCMLKKQLTGYYNFMLITANIFKPRYNSVPSCTLKHVFLILQRELLRSFQSSAEHIVYYFFFSLHLLFVMGVACTWTWFVYSLPHVLVLSMKTQCIKEHSSTCTQVNFKCYLFRCFAELAYEGVVILKLLNIKPPICIATLLKLKWIRIMLISPAHFETPTC